MKHHIIACLVLLIVTVVGCNPKNCYDLTLQFGRESSIHKDTPILVGEGIVGFVDEVRNLDSAWMINVCIPKAIKIPRDSKLDEGFIIGIGKGIKITEGEQNHFFKDGDVLIGSHMDSIVWGRTNSKTDSDMIEHVVETLKAVVDSIKREEK